MRPGTWLDTVDEATREARWALTLLLTAFVFCKVAGITDVAGWAWWQVLTPLWVPAVVAAVAVAVWFVGERVAVWLEEREEARAKAEREVERGVVDVTRTRARMATAERLTVSTFLPPNPVEQLAQAAGITVTYVPHLEEWRVRDVTGGLGFAITRADLTNADRDHRNSEDEVLVGMIAERLAKLRA